MDTNLSSLRTCLRDPISEIFDAARYLDAAVSAHLAGKIALADELIRLADMPAIREWTESLWGRGGPWTRPLRIENPLPFVVKDERVKIRMPSKADMAALIKRDGFHCRFCGIPVVRAEVRTLIHRAYPKALPWGTGNANQHAGFQALWVQYDHLLPHARGGANELSNMLVTCGPCNFGRNNLTLEEAGLADPRLREPVRSTWDGLERFRL
jgi:5-methylcytosine-specific restriction endonuclease McrA